MTVAAMQMADMKNVWRIGHSGYGCAAIQPMSSPMMKRMLGLGLWDSIRGRGALI
jgi:hypothetical protein